MSVRPRRASAATSWGWARSISSHSCHSSTVMFGCMPGSSAQPVTAAPVSETTAR
jgi:hypothetical protein